MNRYRESASIKIVRQGLCAILVFMTWMSSAFSQESAVVLDPHTDPNLAEVATDAAHTASGAEGFLYMSRDLQIILQRSLRDERWPSSSDLPSPTHVIPEN